MIIISVIAYFAFSVFVFKSLLLNLKLSNLLIFYSMEMGIYRLVTNFISVIVWFIITSDSPVV